MKKVTNDKPKKDHGIVTLDAHVIKEKDYTKVESLIHNKFGKESWYGGISSYLLQRYTSIENRILETFRYVDCHPSNRNTFSYEYASILRDTGSVFGSVMDRLVRKTSSGSKQHNIRDYRKWLRHEVKNIHCIAAEINSPLAERLLLPFLPLKNEGGGWKWWDAYNDVKHSDIDKFQAGNFENALNAVASLAVLLTLVRPGVWTKLFPKIGFHEKVLRNYLFF